MTKDNLENEHYRTDLNKPVFKCVLGFARAIDRHSLQQVRQLLFSLLETLTLAKQSQSEQQCNRGRQIN